MASASLQCEIYDLAKTITEGFISPEQSATPLYLIPYQKESRYSERDEHFHDQRHHGRNRYSKEEVHHHQRLDRGNLLPFLTLRNNYASDITILQSASEAQKRAVLSSFLTKDIIGALRNAADGRRVTITSAVPPGYDLLRDQAADGSYLNLRKKLAEGPLYYNPKPVAHYDTSRNVIAYTCYLEKAAKIATQTYRDNGKDIFYPAEAIIKQANTYIRANWAGREEPPFRRVRSRNEPPLSQPGFAQRIGQLFSSERKTDR